MLEHMQLFFVFVFVACRGNELKGAAPSSVPDTGIFDGCPSPLHTLISHSFSFSSLYTCNESFGTILRTPYKKTKTKKNERKRTPPATAGLGGKKQKAWRGLTRSGHGCKHLVVLVHNSSLRGEHNCRSVVDGFYGVLPLHPTK